MEKVRLAVVGAGGIGRSYADLLASSPSATCLAVVDVDRDAAETMAASLGCDPLVSVEALAGIDALEAVVVCTPPNTHTELATQFARDGVHVLCEKPLSVDRHGARAMADAAEQAGTVLAMATKFRFCADVARAVELIENGAIGAVRLVENAFTSRVDMRGRWNAEPAVAGGGVLVDNGTHSVDLMRHVAGSIAEVLAVEASRPEGLAVEDTARLHLRTETGIDAHVDLSWSIDKSLADFLRVYGTEGEIRVGWRESAWRIFGGEWEVVGPGYAKAPAMGGALDAFCRAVRGDTTAVVPAEEGVAAATCIDAAYESLRRGAWVKLAELDGS
jgi:predicted dehydrogenase